MTASKRFLVLFLLACAAWAQQRSEIVNGSFEEGPNPGSFVNLAGGTTSIRGWEVTGEGIDYVGGLWRAAEGARSIDLDGSRPSRLTPPYAQGGVAQTFTTKPGTRYLVHFYLAGNPFGRPVVKALRVSAAGDSKDFSFDVTRKNAAQMGWTLERWTFTANAETTRLEFRSLTPAGQTGWGAVIDNVAVFEVRE